MPLLRVGMGETGSDFANGVKTDYLSPRRRLLFAYGSLLHPESAYLDLQLGTAEGPLRYLPGYIPGYRLAWSVGRQRKDLIANEEEHIAAKRWATIVCQYTGDQEDRTYGAVLGLSDDQWNRLVGREQATLSPEPLRARFVPDGSGAHLAGQIYIFTTEAIDESFDAVRSEYQERILRALEWLHPPSMRGSGYVALGQESSLPVKPISAETADDAVARAVSSQGVTRLAGMEDRLDDYLFDLGVLSSGAVVPSLIRPIAVTRDVYDELCDAAAVALRDHVEAANEMLSHGIYPNALGLNDEIVAAMSPAYSEGATIGMPSVARADLVMYRGEVKVIEVNSDSPAGARHVDVLFDWLAGNWGQFGDPFDALDWTARQPLQITVSNEMSRRWRDSDSGKIAAEKPNVGIVDFNWSTSGTRYEYQSYEELLRSWAASVKCYRPSDLTVDGTTIKNDIGEPIHIVYKRMLLGEFARNLARPDTVTDAALEFLSALASGHALSFNEILSGLVGSKYTTAVVSCEELRRSLGLGFAPEASDVLAETHDWPCKCGILDDGDLNADNEAEVREWTAKSYLGHGGDGVLMAAGGGLTSGLKNLGNEFKYRLNSATVVQRRLNSERLLTSYIGEKELRANSVFSVYLVDGVAEVVEAKLSSSQIVSVSSDASRALVLPVLV